MTHSIFLITVTDFQLVVQNQDHSYYTPYHTLSNGQCYIYASVQQEVEIHPRAATVIFSTFTINNETISISSHSEVKQITMPQGNYRLLFEAIPRDLSLNEKYDTYYLIFIRLSTDHE